MGLTISLTHLAPFVRDSYNRYLQKYKDADVGLTEDEIIELAEKDTKKEIEDAIQTLNYQINSFCISRAQTPFSTVFMYLGETEEYKKELAMLIEETLKQRILGMKNREGQYITVAFPKLIYVLEEDNIHPDSPYYYLTELAAECTAKRMVPDYVSAKVLSELKVAPNGEHCVYGPMGCRSFLTPNYVNPETGKAEFYGRGNIGVTTINLADVALSAQKKCKELGYTPVNESPQVFDQEDMEKFFWPLLEERTELCHDAQKVRFYRLLDTPADVNPILWCDGALSRLDQDEKIGKTIINKHFSSSLG